MYTVLFDIDGTLVNTGGAGKDAFRRTFQEDFRFTQLPDNVTFAGRSDRAIAEEIMLACNVEPTETNWNHFYSGYTKRLPHSLMTCQGTILPGVSTLLETLEKLDHVQLGILTGNVQQGAREKLRYYGMADLFEFGGFGDMRTDRNDIAADAQQAAIDFHKNHGGHQNGQGSPKIMVIGDTPNDVRCARSINAFAVAVATGGNTFQELAATQPDLLLQDLTEPTAIYKEVHSCSSNGAT